MMRGVFLLKLKLNSLKSSEEKDLFEVMFKGREDRYSYFNQYFYRKNDLIIDDLLDYRLHILSNIKSKKDFLDLCKGEYNREAFEQTFIQKIRGFHEDIIKDALKNEKTNIIEIYDNFTDNMESKIITQFV